MSNWFPKNISTYGGDIDHVFYLIFYIVGFWFILTELAIIYFSVRYRRRPGQKAAFIQGEKFAEVAWILVPAAIVMLLDFGIDFASGKVWEKIKVEKPPADVTVRVTGKQFNWLITYPGPDGKFATSDDLQQENELNVPVNKVVQVVLESEDVIHSFCVPNLRLKQDLIPGRKIKAWFKATQPGQYEIACAELCGHSHYTMRGFLIVHTAEEHAKWMKDRWPSS
jgi:cytochrome c oxidase subunit 2